MRDYRDKLIELLAELHQKEGMTRYKIAKRSGISEQTISNVMHKRRNLSIDALQKLLECVGYELDFVSSSRMSTASTQSMADIAAAPPDL